MLCLDWTFPAPSAALPETSFRVRYVGLARKNRLPFRVDASGQPRSGRTEGLVPAQRKGEYMPFKETLEEHQMAGASLRGGLHQQLHLITPAFAKDRACMLGRWIAAHENIWSSLPAFLHLQVAHASFHTAALVVAIAVEEGRLSDAAALLEPESLFESATELLEVSLQRFQDESSRAICVQGDALSACAHE
jgi:hypothetical protein